MAAGQSSTLTGTYAGQFIMGGFLDLRMKKWLRSLITRSCAIVPTIIVAVVYNRSDASLDNLNEWLNVLQGMQIPFALIPLLVLLPTRYIYFQHDFPSEFKLLILVLLQIKIYILQYYLFNKKKERMIMYNFIHITLSLLN